MYDYMCREREREMYIHTYPVRGLCAQDSAEAAGTCREKYIV